MVRFAALPGCLCVVAVLVIFSSGCTPSEPAKPAPVVDPNAPPPPTPEQISKRVITELGLDQPLPPPGSRLAAAARGNVLDMFRRQQAELSKTPAGTAALTIIQKVLEDRISAYERGEFWEHVVTYTDAFAIFQPASKKYERLQERALRELRRPRVTVKGLPEADGHKMALLNIYIPLTSESFDERLSVGEEIHGIKFLGIFGNDRGVRLEFLETGERYIAYMSSQK
jgi:hypothetical protein